MAWLGLKLLFKIVFAGLFLLATVTCLLVYMNSHPPRTSMWTTPPEFGLKYEAVSFRSTDDTKLKAWFVIGKGEGPLPAIIVCHGLGSNRSDFVDLAAHLSEASYHSLLFDFRAHGESEGKGCSFGYHEQKDLKGALNYLTQRKEVDPEKIGVYGFSLGGAVALLAASDDPRVKAIVADSAFASLRDQFAFTLTSVYHLPTFPFLSLTLAIYRLIFGATTQAVEPEMKIGSLSPRAVMIIAGEADTLIPAQNAERLFSAAREPKELWIIPKAAHGQTLSMSGGSYPKRVEEFFDQHVNPE
jgi:dipeptidyl aminopeptidase/acylaminoacyl peptidase